MPPRSSVVWSALTATALGVLGSSAQGRLENYLGSIVQATLLREMAGVSSCNRRTARIESQMEEKNTCRCQPRQKRPGSRKMADPNTPQRRAGSLTSRAPIELSTASVTRSHCTSINAVTASPYLRIEITPRELRRVAEPRQINCNEVAVFGQRRSDSGPGTGDASKTVEQ